MAETRRSSVRWGRLAILVGALCLAAVLGVVGTMNNWYAFALGEVTTVPPTAAPASATPTPSAGATPATSPSSVAPSPAAGVVATDAYKEGFREGKADGLNAGAHEARAEGRKEGLQRGELRGYKVGKKQGYASGYARGREAGYDAGYAKGHRCTKPAPFCKSLGQ